MTLNTSPVVIWGHKYKRSVVAAARLVLGGWGRQELTPHWFTHPWKSHWGRRRREGGSSPDLVRKEKEGGLQILLLDRELVGAWMSSSVLHFVSNLALILWSVDGLKWWKHNPNLDNWRWYAKHHTHYGQVTMSQQKVVCKTYASNQTWDVKPCTFPFSIAILYSMQC